MKPSAALVLSLLGARPRGLTALEALDAGAGDRLAARINELRAAGHHIRDSWETTANGARIKRYQLVPPAIAAPIRGRQQPLVLA